MNDQERAAFEAWFEAISNSTDDADAMWLAWKAGRAALAAAPVQAVPEFSDAAWALAQKVRADLDRQSCPGVYMDIAMESIARNLAAAPVQAVPDAWRKLAIQFDGQRMQALAHLRAMLQDPAAHADVAKAFLAAAPAAPQVPAERVPLTDEQIAEISVSCALVTSSDIYFARAIEQAHGIRAAGVKEPGNAAAHRTLEAERRKGSGAA